MIILMRMIPLILFLLDLLLNAIDLQNVKQVKKESQRINANSMTSNKNVGLVYGKRRKVEE